MTNRQFEVLEYIKRFIASRGYSPTVREIMEGLGLKSPSSVQDHLKKLVAQGLITIDKNKSRTIELLVQNEYERKEENVCVIPILNDIDNSVTREFLDVPKFMLNDYDEKNLYAYPSGNSIYIVNVALKNTDRLSLVVKGEEFMIEDEPVSDIFGNIVSMFERF